MKKFSNSMPSNDFSFLIYTTGKGERDPEAHCRLDFQYNVKSKDVYAADFFVVL